MQADRNIDYYGRPANRERGYSNSSSNKQQHYDHHRREGRGYRDVGHYEDRNKFHGSSRDHELKDWKCMECSSWNYPSDRTCGRCGADPYKAPSPPRQDDRHGDRYQEKETNMEVDEFGRWVANKKPPQQRFPPQFETNGTAFEFDSRSGMFYEKKSDFFYDPKTKLYYGHKQSTYYSYNSEKKKFEEVQKVETKTEETSLDPTPIMDSLKPGASSQDKGKKNAISIKLKTKAFAKTKNPVKKANDVKVAVAPLVSKKHASDIEKWSERQAEKSRDEPKKIATTAKGEPICVLCRRKFPTMEKLQYHERVSKLHQENLAKQLKVEKPEQSYVDRAQHRRNLYGPEGGAVAPVPPISDTHSVVSSCSETNPDMSSNQPKHDDLGETNIGNKMLQKLGWKSGQHLGRTPDTNTGAEALKQDWDRIEFLASNGGAVGQQSKGIGSHQ